MKATILPGALLVLLTSLFARAAVHLVPDQYPNIQAAMDDCNDGDTVIIAPGTYTGPGNRDIDFKGKAITVRSADPEDRNVVSATVVDCNGAARGFIFQTREKAGSILAGLTIAHASYQGVRCERADPLIQNCRFAKNSAAGIDTYDSELTITNCEFIGNYNYSRGGAIDNYSSSPTITGCTFIGNTARDYGGAIGFASSAVINNCIFEGNSARWGGALYGVSGSRISDCTFVGNSGGGSAVCGSGATIERCTFNANMGTAVSTDGGWISVSDCIFADTKGSAVSSEGQAYLTFDRCILRNNGSSAYGGAFRLGPSSRLTLSNSVLTGNSAREDGGAIACERAAPTIVNCVFASNTAGHRGGGIFLNDECFLTMTNSTLTGNSAGIGAAVAFHFFGTGTKPNHATIANCILWDGRRSIEDFYGGSIIDVTFSNVEGGYDGEGNISVDPGFALGSDFHLMPDSPCVDAGNNDIGELPSTDVEGSPRILDGDLGGGAVVDMGAYEYNPDRPAIATSADRITFVHHWPEPEEQTREVQIRNCGGRPLNWRIEQDCEWLTVTPASGLSTDDIDQITITLKPIDLEPGFYNAVVSVIDETAVNSPVNIDISLHVPGTLHVPAEHATIQGAIDMAQDYDVIIVADGVYSGEGNHNIDYRGKPLTIMSENGPENCIVDCNGEQYERFNGFLFLDGEDANSILDGFTIINAGEHAVYCHRANATIRNCIMSNCAGSAIRAWRETNLSITNCIMFNNTAARGGALNTYNAHAILSNCLIHNNTATEEGGGIYLESGSTTLINCTITGNSSEEIGGGIRTEFYNNCTLRNCIVFGNPTGLGEEISATSYCCYPEVDITYSNIKGGWPGAGNIDGNPLFMNPADSDFHLSADSPCIDAGDPNYVPFPDQTDMDGEPRMLNGRIEMGADELPYDGPLIAAWPGTFEFFAYEAGSNPSAQALCVYYKGLPGPGWEVTEDCDWLEVAVLPEGEPNDLEVIVDVSGMPGGYYHCGFAITDPAAENSPRVVPVDLHVLGPVMEVSATLIEFSAEKGGPNPEDQTFTVHNSGGGTLNWGVTYIDDCSWLGVAPTAGASVGEIDEITVSVEVSGLTVGTYTCVLEVSDLDSTNGRHTVTVVIHIFDHTLRVPLQFPTIQGAIDHVLERGTVIVADGIYSGEGNHDIDFKGKAITVRSENGPENCIIDCSDSERWYAHRGFYFHSGEDSNSVLSGFTITNGRVAGCFGHLGGGAILCSSSSPMIANCIITNNKATGGCIVGGSSGGGVWLLESRATITNCIITGNMAYGGAGGIHCYGSSPIITNCTICDNIGSGIWGVPYYGEPYHPIIANCILWGNSLEQMVVDPNTTVVTFSNVQGGWPGLGNISEDPLFVGHGYWDPNGTTHATYDDFWVNGDYHLKSNGWRWDAQRKDWTWDEITSRCIDAGNPGSPLGEEPLSIHADPNNEWGQNLRINMGAYGGTAEASMPPYGWAIRSDYNNDGIANFTDFACWSIYHGYILPEPSDDSSPSPTLNSADLALLADRWLGQTTWFTTPSPASSLPPNAASNPNPPDGSVGIRLAPVLSWQGGFDAVSHDIYFGTANPPPFQTNQPGRTFEPGPLSPLTAYYWRIDEVKPYGTTAGPVWTFTTSSAGGR